MLSFRGWQAERIIYCGICICIEWETIAGFPLYLYGSIDSAGEISEPGFLMSLVLAVAGALLVLFLYRLFKGKGPRPLAHS